MKKIVEVGNKHGNGIKNVRVGRSTGNTHFFFLPKYSSSRSKSIDWLDQSQDEQHVHHWTAVSVNQSYKNPAQLIGLIQSGYHRHLVETVTCSQHDVARQTAHLISHDFNRMYEVTKFLPLFFSRFFLVMTFAGKKFEDTKGVIRSCKSKKERQYNCQKKKDKQRSTKH